MPVTHETTGSNPVQTAKFKIVVDKDYQMLYNSLISYKKFDTEPRLINICMKHIHHIIPRHMGGTDDSSNLIELTVEEHAEAHRLLYEQHGKEEDRIAWLALCGQITHEEAVREGKRLGRQKTNEILKERYGDDWKKIIARKGNDRLLEILKQDPDFLRRVNPKSFLGKKHKEESKKKIGEKNSKHQKGEGNSQYGTCWITNGTDSIKVKKDSPIPEGWRKGRKINSGGGAMAARRAHNPETRFESCDRNQF